MSNLTGQQVGKYALETVAGSGATGAVYRARQEKQLFALKIIHPQLVEQSGFRQALLDQANTLTHLRHHAIAQIYEIGEQRGQLYVLTEWVAGETLAELRRHQPAMSLALVGNLAIQIAEGLVYAHRQGAVHGGLHPGNVLLKPTGGATPWQAVLTDFRLTSLMPGTPPLTLLPYLAPEQVSGRRVDARSDIFALGVMLYQMATGRLPFNPQTAAEASNTGGAPPPPTSLRADMPPAFAALILQAAARPIRDRFRSMEELLTALRREVGQLPHSLPAAPPPAQPVAAPPAPLQSQPATPAVPAGQKAIIVDQPEEPASQYLVQQKWLITIGQMDGNDLVLPAEGVTAKHARLERKEDGRWFVVDMNSRGGTFLEGSPLLPDVPQEWRLGQELSIGPYTLTWGQSRPPAANRIQDYAPPEKPAEPLPLPPPKLSLKLTLPHVQVIPGEPTKGLALEIENGMEITTVIRLSVNHIPEGWVTMEAGSIHLLPRQKVQVPLVIQPPRHHSARAGHHPYQIKAEPANGRGETAVCQGNLTIAPFSRLLVETQPFSLKHGRPGQVIVHNESNAPEPVNLTAIDINQTLRFDLPQGQTEIASGESQSLPLRVWGQKGRALIWPAKITPFELQVQGKEKSILVNGRVVIPPLIPWWAPLLAIPLLLVAAFLIAKPAFCSTDQGKVLAQHGSGRWQGLCAMESLVEEEPTSQTAAQMVTPQETVVVVEEVTDVPSVIEAVTAVPPTSTSPPAAVAPQRLEIGRSVNDVPIEAVAFGNGPDGIVFVGGIHAGYAPASVHFAEAVIAYFQNDPAAVAAIPANITVYIIPDMNPDAFASAAPGDNAKRVNANGVNLNSNWPCNWGTGSQPGSSALSEPESQAVYNFIVAPERHTVATIFWNMPVNVSNQRAISPGRCTAEQTAVSAQLMNAYADAISSYTARQADPNQRFSGDATDSIANEGIPSIFVLLDNAVTANIDEHIPAIEAVLQAYAQN